MDKQNLEKIWPSSSSNCEDKISNKFDSSDHDPLCCCEYYNKNDERYHILLCCCNCNDFDESIERLICCKSLEEKYCKGMLLTFQDRLRIPWSGGAKQISLDAIIPIFLIPIILGLTAFNIYTAVIILIAACGFLGFSFYSLKQQNIYRSKFYFMWMFWSVIYLLVLFEFTAPLLEILPEENYVLMLLLGIGTFCLYKTKMNAHKNAVVQSLVSKDDLPDITEEQTSVLIENEENSEHNNPNICQNCRKYVPPRTFHCLTCQSCVIRRDHHSYWLDCCIGASNHRCYYFGLVFSLFGLLFGANLTLTSVCHPSLIFTIFGVRFFLPDDCSDIFEQYDISLAFIASIYAVTIGMFVLITILMQTYLISKGITLSEWQVGQKSGNRKSICYNIRSFLMNN